MGGFGDSTIMVASTLVFVVIKLNYDISPEAPYSLLNTNVTVGTLSVFK